MPLSKEIYMIKAAAFVAENDGFPNTAKKLRALAEKVELYASRITLDSQKYDRNLIDPRTKLSRLTHE